MFDFGIPGYQPDWLRGLQPVTAAHGSRLAALPGCILTRTAVVWDGVTDTWFADAPVLLDFDGTQLEINHQNLDALSITWDSIDLNQPITWPVDGFDLHWRHNAPDPLADVHGQRLQSLDLLEWACTDAAQGMIALCFTFPERQMTIYNGLDENALALIPPDLRYTRHPLPPRLVNPAGTFAHESLKIAPEGDSSHYAPMARKPTDR